MIRVVATVAGCIALAGCTGDALRELEAKQRAEIDARRIPDVALMPAQTTLLKKPSDRSRIAWVRAGTQSDGKIFVCYVTSTPPPPTIWGSDKTIFGESRPEVIQVHSGTFEANGTFKANESLLIDDVHFHDCRSRGINPPVRAVLTVNGVRAN